MKNLNVDIPDDLYLVLIENSEYMECSLQEGVIVLLWEGLQSMRKKEVIYE